MQMHPYRLPDELPKEYCRFSRASLEQLKHYFCRKLTESSTVATLIVDLRGGAFGPGDPFPAWWDAKARAYSQGGQSGPLRVLFSTRRAGDAQFGIRDNP